MCVCVCGVCGVCVWCVCGVCVVCVCMCVCGVCMCVVCVCVCTPHITQSYTESRTASDSLERPIRQYYTSLEAFASTEFNEIFSGKQPYQDVKVF